MRPPHVLRSVAGLVLIAVTITPGALRAQPTAGDKALAEGLFQDARKLMEAGQVAEACPKFAESQRIDPSLGTLLNLAVCHEKEGKTASAWAEFKEAAALAASSGKQDRADFAAKRAGEIEARLSRLSLDVAQPAPGMVITLNHKQLSATAAAGSGIPVDPGEVTVEATAPGMQPWSERVVIEAGPSVKQLTIPALAAVPTIAPPVEKKPPPPPPKRPPPPRPAAPEGRVLRTLGFVAGGVGLAGIGVGSAFGVMTLMKASDVEAACKDGCSRDDVRSNEDAKDTAMVSNIAFGAGAACLGASVVMILLSRSPKKDDVARPTTAWISPELGSTGGLVTFKGVW